MKFVLIFFSILGYVYSQTNCGTCFPGTSSSQCGYRKPTDPILCCSDGKKYTPCTYTCVRACNPNLRIVGCGSTCVGTTTNTCPPVPAPTPAPVTPAPITPAPVTPTPITPAPVTTAPITPKPITPAPVTPAPITPAPVTPAPVTPAPACKEIGDEACQFTPPTTTCGTPRTAAMEDACTKCSAESPAAGGCTVDCAGLIDPPCDGEIAMPESVCEINDVSEACTTCPIGSPAKGTCP